MGNWFDLDLYVATQKVSNFNQARDIVKKHYSIRDSKSAEPIASILVMWSHDETIPLDYYKMFFRVFGLDQVDKVEFLRFSVRQILETLDRMDNLFSEKSLTRGSNDSVRIILAYQFYIYATGQTYSKKLIGQTMIWFDEWYLRWEKSRRATPMKKYKEYLAALEHDFEVEVMARWRQKTDTFSPLWKLIIIKRANWRCQWKAPDGKVCGIKLKYAKLEIDHEVPRRSGGETNPQNARVICKERNRTWGKGCMFDQDE